MTALYIVLGIFAFFALLFWLPIQIYVWMPPDGALQYKLRYACFSLVDSTKEKKPKPEKQKKEEPPKEEKPPKKKKKGGGVVSAVLKFLGMEDIASIANAKKAISEKGVCGLLSDLASAVGAIFARIFKLLRKGVFKRFTLGIVVGDSDAADAAMTYGTVCGTVYPVLTMLDSAMKFKRRDVDIRCDFEREETQFSFDVQLNYRPWHFICFVFGMIWNYLKRSVKK